MRVLLPVFMTDDQVKNLLQAAEMVQGQSSEMLLTRLVIGGQQLNPVSLSTQVSLAHLIVALQEAEGQ